ncbi:MAG: MFS transporter [Chloroflexi bacterium]|nr:MFS transporter [Chloroflexota bacterium]
MHDGTSSAREAASGDDPDGLWTAGRRALTIGLILNVTIVASEALAGGTILPVVAGDLGGIDLYGWVFSGFFLGTLLGIVVAGMLIDQGHLSRPFLMGIGLFSLGLLIGGLAPSMEVLVVGRVIQGLGAGAIPAVAYVSIARAMPERLRPRMFATLSSAWILPGVLGPNVAVAVTGLTNWRIVFLGLLPFIIVAAWLTLPAIRAVGASHPREAGTDPGDSEAASAAKVAADRRRLPLALVLVLGAGLIVSGLSNVSPAPLVLILVGLAIGVPAFARLTPPGTLRAAPGLPTAILLRGFLTFAFFCADAYVPLALQTVRQQSSFLGGLAYTSATLTWAAASWFQAQRVQRLGPGRFLAAGFAVLFVGVAAFLLVLVPEVPAEASVVIWGVAGIGMGLAYSTPSLVVLREASVEEQGAATAGLQLSDVLGASLGTGVGGALIAFGVRAGSPPGGPLAVTFGISAGVAVIGLLLTRRLGRAATASGRPPIPLATVPTGGGPDRGHHGGVG